MEAEQTTEPEKRKRGRPKGSKNKVRNADAYQVPPSGHAFEAYRGDPQTIVARMFTMLDFAQQAVSNQFKDIMESKAPTVMKEDIEQLEKLGNTLHRTLMALQKSSDLAEEMAKRMTPEQLIEAAIKKIEGQDLNTLNAIIKRLRQTRARLAPVSNIDKVNMGDTKQTTAVEAIQSLLEDE